jgi:hypothetical protein
MHRPEVQGCAWLLQWARRTVGPHVQLREHMHMTIPNSELQSVSPSAHYGLLEQNERYDAALAPTRLK